MKFRNTAYTLCTFEREELVSATTDTCVGPPSKGTCEVEDFGSFLVDDNNVVVHIIINATNAVGTKKIKETYNSRDIGISEFVLLGLFCRVHFGSVKQITPSHMTSHKKWERMRTVTKP